jgi:hypothetical protein
MQSMDTLRTLARNPGLALAWPSAMLAVAISLDQFTRGPSVTAMAVQYLLRA